MNEALKTLILAAILIGVCGIALRNIALALSAQDEPPAEPDPPAQAVRVVVMRVRLADELGARIQASEGREHYDCYRCLASDQKHRVHCDCRRCVVNGQTLRG